VVFCEVTELEDSFLQHSHRARVTEQSHEPELSNEKTSCNPIAPEHMSTLEKFTSSIIFRDFTTPSSSRPRFFLTYSLPG
jgi:hypothetical protein